jgi:hypothetical protein
MSATYTVSVGEDYLEVTTTLISIQALEISSGQLISNDKFAINNCLNTMGGTAELKEVEIYIYNSAGAPSTANMDLWIFRNLNTATLGVASGSTFALDYTNNLSTDVKPKISFTSWDTVDANTAVSRQSDINMRITPKDETQYSLSGALEAAAAITLGTQVVTIITHWARN